MRYLSRKVRAVNTALRYLKSSASRVSLLFTPFALRYCVAAVAVDWFTLHSVLVSPIPSYAPTPPPVVHCAVDTPLLASRPSHGHGAGSSAGPASGPTPRHLSVQVDGVGVGDGGVLDFQRVGCLCSLGSPYCTPKLQRHRVRYQGVPWSFSTASPVLYRILRSSNIFAEVVASGMNIWRCACVVAPCVCSRGQPCPHQRPAGACSSPLAPPCPLLSTTVALLRDCPPRVQQV